jgi:(p)ppGpp synthase/HD superfamily hydrolase
MSGKEDNSFQFKVTEVRDLAKVTEVRDLAKVTEICGLLNFIKVCDWDDVAKADFLAEGAHAGQFRKSGEAYIDHPRAVQKIIREELGIEDEIILISALLHDTIEDTDLKLFQIEEIFGHDVAEIVDGVTKLKYFTEKQATQKVFDKLVLQPAVALIKLADRLHNMRTQKHMSPEQRIKKAQETFNTYIPMAESLGMWEVKRELEDLCYENSEQGSFDSIKQSIAKDTRSSENFQNIIVDEIKQVLGGDNCFADISIREEGKWFISQKLKELKTNNLREIDDIISIRLVVSTQEEMYKALGFLDKHESQRIDSKKCDRYINYNKQSNGYQAIHTNMHYAEGPVEIAIVTKEMEDFNNWGIISLIRQGKNISELKEYFLKPIFVHGDQVRFVPKNAKALDIIRNPEKFKDVDAVLVNGEKFPLNKELPSNCTMEIIYSDVPRKYPLERLDPSAYLPPAREILEKFKEQKERDNTIIKGKKIARNLLSSRGFLSLSYLEIINEVSYRRLVNNFGKNEQDLYYSIANELSKKDDFIKKLDELGVTKDLLKVTTIEIIGEEDNSSILSDVVTKIKGIIMAGDEHVNSNNTFYLCKVVKNMSKEAEDELRKHLTSRFLSVLVV